MTIIINIIRYNAFRLSLIAVVLCFLGCSKPEKQFVIGVSQCSEDIWRHKLNDELRMGAYFHDGVELKMTCAVGFTAPSYFTKCFKDEFGVSPSEVHS